MISTVTHETASSLGSLARELASSRTVGATLETIVRSAARTVHGVTAAGVSFLSEDHSILARAQSSALVTSVDDLQTQLRQGPCLHVLTKGADLVRIDDLERDARWPKFAQGAVEYGVRSVLSFRLFMAETTLGNLSLFSDQQNAFDATSEYIGELYATHAAVALSGVRLEQQLNVAIRNRDVIGQAKGILMTRHGLDEETAFATLVKFSQTEHLKLFDVAVSIVDTLAKDRSLITSSTSSPGSAASKN